jgi:peptidoglycan/xylan/chitin deacetylase (PgdA/CDA1 family)
MKRTLKRATLQLLKSTGVFALVRDSGWRKQRLLILCFHGIALDDEHLWRPGLYLAPSHLEQRLQCLHDGGYNVLPLGRAVTLLQAGDLPARSVAITFDDGTYDFCAVAHPLLRKFGFPATVYQTTYYCGLQIPVFNLITSYLLWKRRDRIIDGSTELGLMSPLDLRTEEKRCAIVQMLMDKCKREHLNALQRNEVAARLAQLLEIDYAQILSGRLLQLMNPEEIVRLTREGVDFQLHTHRHRGPEEKQLFQKEICDNRECLLKIRGGSSSDGLVHFCYPSGEYRREFLPWLSEEDVRTATTCDPGLATVKTNPLLLPRIVETSGRTALEFESWLTGVADIWRLLRLGHQNRSAALEGRD